MIKTVKTKKMTDKECLEILESLDCSMSEAHIEECKEMLRMALKAKNNFILWLYKSLEELRALAECAKHYGLDFLKEESPVTLYYAKQELEQLTHILITGSPFLYSDGKKNERKPGAIIIEKICYVAGIYNRMKQKMDLLGLIIKNDAFEGHYKKMVDANKKAFIYLCGISGYAAAEAEKKLDAMTPYNYTNESTLLYDIYFDENAEKALEDMLNKF